MVYNGWSGRLFIPSVDDAAIDVGYWVLYEQYLFLYDIYYVL